MTCRITVYDGTNTAVMDDCWELGMDFDTIEDGGALLRFLDGSLATQLRWRKELYGITGQGKVPTGIRQLDYSQQLTITVETGLGTDQYTGRSLGPSEQWDMTGGTVSWTLSVEQD